MAAKVKNVSLANIPDNISVDYLANSSAISGRAKERGLNYFTQGYVHNIRISQGENTVIVDANCYRSMGKTKDPHKLHLELSGDRATDAYCSCKAGLSGCCSHMIGLLKSLQGLKLHNFTEVPDQLSCTSIPKQWDVPRGPKILPVPMSHVVVARPSEERKRKPVLCQVDTKSKLPKISSEEIQALSALERTPLAYMMNEDIPKVNSPLGHVQLGSVLSYQMSNVKSVAVSTSTGCGNTRFPKASPIQLPSEFKNLNNGYRVDSETTEAHTRSQADCEAWREARSTRLTASNFGKVLKRKAVPSKVFLASIFNSKDIKAAPLDYGKSNEPNAKTRYFAKHTSIHFHECGLVINNEFCFLGASPDGKICDNGRCGILEIKCPYAARNSTISDACDKIQNFALQKSNGSISLKRDHIYYAQVQGQLMIPGADFCEFVVFTQTDLHIERILPDILFMTELLQKLASFFKNYALPYLNETPSS